MSDYVPNTEITDDDKLWSLLSYIFMPLIPLIMLLLEDKKNRKFIKFHAIQSLVFGVIAYVISGILAPIVGIGCFVGIAAWGYGIYLGIKAFNGDYVEIPFITDFCKKQGWIS
jgi:uncharacterized membrane protein